MFTTADTGDQIAHLIHIEHVIDDPLGVEANGPVSEIVCCM